MTYTTTRRHLAEMSVSELADEVLNLREANQRLLTDLRQQEKRIAYIRHELFCVPLAIIESSDHLMRIDEHLRRGGA